MLLVLACAYGLYPDDPLLLDSGFPWLWLAASLFALRYGALLGVLAGLCIVAAWFLFYGSAPAAQFPTMLFSAGFIQLLILGHFCDLWAARVYRLRAMNAYLDSRLTSITHAHFVLKVSHERLEKDLLSRPVTLRDAVDHIRSLGEGAPDSARLPKAQDMLDFVAGICRIETASLFQVRGESLDPQAVALLGGPLELDPNDPLVQECVKNRGLAHLRSNDAAQSSYLACAPIVSASGTLIGLLAIRDMAFLSVNQDNFQLLLVLLNYYADGLEQSRLVEPVCAELPQCPQELALELVRLAHMKRSAGIPSSLLALVIPRGTAHDAVTQTLLQVQRKLDLHWSIENARSLVLVFLLPLADQEGVTAFLARAETGLNEHFNTNLLALKISTCSAPLEANQPAAGLRQLLSRCADHA